MSVLTVNSPEKFKTLSEISPKCAQINQKTVTSMNSAVTFYPDSPPKPNPVKYTDPDGREEVYFLYVYKEADKVDQDMKAKERKTIDNEVKYLQDKGVSVKVVENAKKDDVLAAFNDQEAKIIITSGHGRDGKYGGGIQTADGDFITPNDITKETLSSNLKTVIFENCHQGDQKENWSNALGDNVNIVGWKGVTTVSETKRFNNSGFFDRQSKNLKSYLKDVVK
jgi:hypothetical protein